MRSYIPARHLHRLRLGDHATGKVGDAVVCIFDKDRIVEKCAVADVTLGGCGDVTGVDDVIATCSAGNQIQRAGRRDRPGHRDDLIATRGQQANRLGGRINAFDPGRTACPVQKQPRKRQRLGEIQKGARSAENKAGSSRQRDLRSRDHGAQHVHLDIAKGRGKGGRTGGAKGDTGATGPTGTTGPKGDPGTGGITGYPTSVTTNEEFAPDIGTSHTTYAECASGLVPINGYYQIRVKGGLSNGAMPVQGFAVAGAGIASNYYFVEWSNTRPFGDHLQITVTVNCATLG